ncbi:HAD family hydrolase [Photobacterium aquae]|uniref:HAD family hydrolase n=1 Tax=Photobacterium aquae TaxID=1195763 RepID=A0A0J1H0K6_9GAMM|nr:HAD family phosphatase [Photobacterium aquae]KLV05355.1 HAD family hydrolase [Photobacterium aquae]
MIRNVIFDFGAVLLHWNPSKIVESFTEDTNERQILLNYVIHHPDWLALDRGTMLMAEVIPRFALRTGMSEARIGDFIEHIQSTLTIIPETETLVDQVIALGFGTYFLTNMSSAFFEKLNEQHSFYVWFDGGLVSGKELLLKPEPEIFKRLAERFMLNPEESLFIDDSPANITAAKHLGFQTYLFTTPTISCEAIRNLLNIN